MKSILWISFGASLGAILRWLLGVGLNPLFPQLPLALGTLSANWIGGFLMGGAIAFLGGASLHQNELRLFVMTGFLGGLTTFSAFSGELFVLLQQGRWGAAGMEASLHVLGALATTAAGFALAMWWKGG